MNWCLNMCCALYIFLCARMDFGNYLQKVSPQFGSKSHRRAYKTAVCRYPLTLAVHDGKTIPQQRATICSCEVGHRTGTEKIRPKHNIEQ